MEMACKEIAKIIKSEGTVYKWKEIIMRLMKRQQNYQKHKTLGGCPEISQNEGTYQSWEFRNNNPNIYAVREKLERLIKEKESTQYIQPISKL